jgi:hypothetical protein
MFYIPHPVRITCLRSWNYHHQLIDINWSVLSFICVCCFLLSLMFQTTDCPAMSCSAAFLLSLIFSPEDGCDLFLWNIGLSLNYLALREDHTLCLCCSTNNISYMMHRDVLDPISTPNFTRLAEEVIANQTKGNENFWVALPLLYIL